MPPRRLLYSLSERGLALHGVDTSSGALERLPVALPDFIFDEDHRLNRLVADPRGRYLFALTGERIYAYEVHGTDGHLQPAPGSPFKLRPFDTIDMAIDRDGDTAYVVTGIGSLMPFAIGPHGTLTEGVDYCVANGDSVAVDPLGRFVFESERLRYSGYDHPYSLNVLEPASKGLTWLHSARALGDSIAAVDPKGRFLYSGGLFSDSNGVEQLRAFQIQPTGELAAAPRSPFSFSVRGKVDAWAIDPTGQFLYSSAGASAWIDPDDGSLYPMTGPYRRGPLFDSGALAWRPRPIIIDLQGHLYVGDSGASRRSPSTGPPAV